MKGRSIAWLLLAAGLSACGKKVDGPAERPPPRVEPPPDPSKGAALEPEPAPPRAGDDRVALVPEDHPLFSRVEGEDFPNACNVDGDCFAAGCSGEVCSAEQGVITTCEALPLSGWPEDATCGCVVTRCQWYSPSGATVPRVTPTCDGKPCEPPRECIEYYGIAGPRGPKFQSCELRCKPSAKDDGGCPEGTKCTTIADGPGSVCR